MKAVAAVVALWAVRQGLALTITSCGGAEDVLGGVLFTVTEDPFSLRVTGTMKKALTRGGLATDLDVSVLGGLVKIPMKGSSTFEFTPGFPARDIAFSLGPFTLPAIASMAQIKGQVVVSDEAGAPVACMALDGRLAAAAAAEEEAPESPAAGLTGWSSCGQGSDHLKNPTITTEGQTSSISGSLDEDVGAGAVAVDMSVVLFGSPVPLQMSIPFEMEPAIPQGDVRISMTSSSAMSSPPESVQEVQGSVRFLDAGSEQIWCVAVGEEEAAAAVHV